MSPRQRTAIVTGAGGGIGAACAAAIAAGGVHVALFDIDETAAQRALAEIAAAGGSGTVHRVDCGDPEDVENAVADHVARHGSVDILVSTVALEKHGRLLDTDAASLRASFDVTVVGAFALIRTTATAMVAHGGGRIVVISSPHAIRPFAGALSYNVAEAALRQLALTAAHELAEYRVSVNLVEPGWTDTPGERLFYSEEFLAESASKLPWKRRAKPREIAAAVGYLVSDAADYVSGTTLRVDGAMGVSMARLPGLEG